MCKSVGAIVLDIWVIVCFNFALILSLGITASKTLRTSLCKPGTDKNYPALVKPKSLFQALP